MDFIENLKQIEELKRSQSEAFADYLNQISKFCEAHKDTTNLNDHESFQQLIKDNIDANLLNNREIIYLAVNLNKEFCDKGQLSLKDIDRIYNQFTELKPKEPKQEELIDELEENLLLSEQISNQNQLEIPQDTQISDEEKDEAINNIKQDINHIEPLQMIEYINSKEIVFPFKREESLGNRSFLTKFYTELDKYSNNDLQEMINQVKAKNEALRAKIKELEKENPSELLIKELEENEKLTNQELSLKQDIEKIKENKEEVLEETKEKEQETKQEVVENVDTSKTEQKSFDSFMQAQMLAMNQNVSDLQNMPREAENINKENPQVNVDEAVDEVKEVAKTRFTRAK